MKMLRLFVLVVLSAGCRSGTATDAGTVVGNPGDNAMRVADGEGVELQAARVGVSRVTWVSCSEEIKNATEVDAEVDLMGPDTFAVPTGTWCSYWVEFSTPLDLELVASDDPGDRGQVSLDVGKVATFSEGGFTIDGDATVLELGYPGWLPLEAFLDDEGDWVADELDSTHPLHDELVEVLIDGSALFEDRDADGQISEQERDDSELAHGDIDELERVGDDVWDDVEEDTQPSSDGGCGSSSAWLFFPMGLLGVRRRLAR